MKPFNEIINDDRPVLVDFYATWCGPCKMLHPILDELKNRIGDAAEIVRIDVDQHEDLAFKYAIQSVPTLMIFKNGKQMWRRSGIRTASDLEKVLKQYS